MKTKIFFIICAFMVVQFVSAGSPFYYESISNPTKTINYIIGFYPSQYSISTASDNKEYVAYSGAVINSSSTTLSWNDYYMIVKKKNGDLVFSYLTAATSGEYACKFSVVENETHHTKFCFHDTFKPDDIADVYLFDKVNMKAFQLVYNENK